MASFKDYLSKVVEDADFDQGKKDKKKTKMKGPFGNNYDAMSLQGRADIDQRTVTARQGDNPMIEGDDRQTNLDRLRTILNELGATDDDIMAGVPLTPKGKQQIAGRLGVAADTIDTMISSLQAHMSADRKSNMLIDSEMNEATWHQKRRPVDPSSPGKWNVHDDPPGNPAGIMSFGTEEEAKAYIERRKKLGTGDHCYLIPPRETRNAGKTIKEDMNDRYSAEIDGLGSITLRDSVTSETKFLQGESATELAKQMEPFHGKPQLNDRLQEVLRTAFLNEASALDGFFLKEFREDKSFENEIASDSGTYNMPWKLDHQTGTMTIFYTLENDKPELKIQSVRDEDGNEIEVDDVKHDELMIQAKDFIGNE